MTTQLSLAFLLALSSVLAQPGRPNFSGRWQFDEARSTYEQATRVIKDLPARLQAKIPGIGVPRLAAPTRFYIKPPIVVTKHVGARLSISAPSWFRAWLDGNSVLFVDGKERNDNRSGISAFTSSARWDGNRIVKEWKEKNAGIYDLCEGRQVFTIADNGKTLTYDSHSTCYFRANLDGRPYEAEDSEDIHTVLVKKRRP
jgi:hypothetical protein